MPTAKKTTTAKTTRAPRRKTAPVEVRQIEGHGSWTKEQAADLVNQGYTPEHVARVTGFPLALIQAQYKAGSYRQLAALRAQR